MTVDMIVKQVDYKFRTYDTISGVPFNMAAAVLENKIW